MRQRVWETVEAESVRRLPQQLHGLVNSCTSSRLLDRHRHGKRAMAGTRTSGVFPVIFLVAAVSPLVCLRVAGRGLGTDPGPVVLATRGAVWPKPQQQRHFPTYMLVRPNEFTFKVIKNECQILKDALQRYSDIIKTQGAMKIEAKKSDIASSKDFAGYLNALSVNLLSPCESLPHLDMDEKYELRVNSPDQPKEALLTSSSIWGILRGLETFSQLLYPSDSNALLVNSTSIMDFPRFPHRGLLLDTSRHYMPLKIIYKTLDGMAMNKFNVFHWHIVDDHSFPYQSKTFPRLSEYGAYTPSHVYSQQDVADIIKYATSRGIRVIAEFDTPGHTRSWGQGHPELLTKCYGKNGPDGSLGPMNPIINTTYTFMDKILNEIKSVFPDKFTHLGGDEVDYQCWESNPELIKYVKDNGINYVKLEEMFVKKVIDLTKQKNLKSIVWQEVFDNGLNVPKETIIHVWKVKNYQQELSKVTSMGYKVLLSSPWYLDHIQGGGDWIKYYNIDPYGFEGTEEQKKKLIGGEACMWSEYVDVTNVMTRVWPRASAAAEKLWSSKDAKSYQEAAPRLEEHTCRLNVRGIAAQPPNGPGFCPLINF